MMKFQVHYIILFLTCVSLPGCKPKQKSVVTVHADSTATGMIKDSVLVSGNTTTILSEDTAKLSRLLTFNHYKPFSVKFKYTFIDNSGSKNRIDIPGPSDFNVEALMNFDSVNFSRFMQEYRLADWADPNYKKEEFNFSWLDSSTRKELLLSDTIPHGYVDLFWTDPNDPKCHIWMLNKKLLLHRTSN